MKVSTRKGPVFDPGLCRCCGNMKKCRLLNVEYEWGGQKENYSDIFVDCFGLYLSNLDVEPTGRLICATCVTRLREANSFRLQVLQCEQRLLQTEIQVDGDGNVKSEEPHIKVETLGVNIISPRHSPVENYAGNDDDSVKSDPEFIPKQKAKHRNKTVKVKKKKLKKERGKDNGEMENVLKYESVHERLQQVDVDTKKPKKSYQINDSELKTFQNTCTLVENTYICPFDTSFSDYYCLYCREVHTDPEKLRGHTLTHDPTIFKEVFNKKTPQIDITKIDCRICNATIDSIEMAKQHLVNSHEKIIHEVNNEFLKFKLTATNLTCLECGVTFGFFHALKKHMAEHFGTCICDICGAHYFEERMLMLHQRTHQRIDENFPCKECGKCFKSKHSRYLHVARTHKKEPAYQCNKCDEILFSYSLRYRHMIEVHGEQRMYPCESCDRTYDSRKSLREHNRRFHLKILKHQCDLCDKRFYLPSRLKEHLATHTGERNYRCEYCGKSYPRLRGLKVHMQSHSTEKKFKCMLCTAAFTQNINLKNHMKRQHQTEGSYHDVAQ
ncbi:zinc finger protein 54-like [Plodia interpunctella]|uniref:zinc finger protein 54-like n=1 Tax=Plodia interpunctella TaxID=58824 RepID=UPI002367D125|nr:zinc finger protein 54-like [Plodia interpunctella]